MNRKKFASVVVSSILFILSGCGGSNNDGAATAPPVVAATVSDGQQAWMNPLLSPADRANALITAMTLDQKIEQLENIPTLNTELQDENPPCGLQDIGRHIEGIPALHIPTFRFANGGNGIRGGDCTPEPTATAFPAAVAGAAAFNPDINFQWGQILGDEVRNWAHYAL